MDKIQLTKCLVTVLLFVTLFFPSLKEAYEMILERVKK